MSNITVSEPIAQLVKKAVDFARTVELVQIDTAQQLENANYLFRILGNHIKDIEAERKKVKQPFLDQAASVDDYFKPPQKELTERKDQIGVAITAYTRMVDEQRRQEQAKLDMIAAENRRKLDAAAQAERDKAEALRQQAAATTDAAEAERLRQLAVKAEIRGDVKEGRADLIVAPIAQVAAPVLRGTAMRKAWKAEITDVEAFVRYAIDNKLFHLLQPNDKALQAWAKSVEQEKEFPGGRIFNDEKLVGARTSR